MPFGHLLVQKYFQHFFTVKPGYSKLLFCIFLRNFGKKQIYICFASTWLLYPIDTQLYSLNVQFCDTLDDWPPLQKSRGDIGSPLTQPSGGHGPPLEPKGE